MKLILKLLIKFFKKLPAQELFITQSAVSHPNSAAGRISGRQPVQPHAAWRKTDRSRQAVCQKRKALPFGAGKIPLRPHDP